MARDRQRAKQRKARRAESTPASAAPRRRSPNAPTLPGELEHSSGEVEEFEAALVAGADGEPDDAFSEDEDPEAGRAEAFGEGEEVEGVDADELSDGDEDARGAGRRRRPRRAPRGGRCAAARHAHPAGPRALHRLPARVVGRAAARTVA